MNLLVLVMVSICGGNWDMVNCISLGVVVVTMELLYSVVNDMVVWIEHTMMLNTLNNVVV